MPTNSVKQTVYFVSCVGQKEQRAFPAKDLYKSTWFKKARSLVESKQHTLFIISAKYGLISPDEVINPYEQTLNLMPINERRIWAEKVIVQIIGSAPRMEQAVFLAGKRYYEFIAHALEKRGIEVNLPIKNLGIGKQLQWIDQNHGKA